MTGIGVLLDRDGTVIADKHYLSDPDGVELLPGAAAGLRRLVELGVTLAVVTNQSGVGRGYFTQEAMHACNQRLTELLAAQSVPLTHFYFCPHTPEEACDCRKPAPGMALQAAEALGLDLTRSFVIGDKPADVNLGKAVGAATILVRTGKGEASATECEPDLVADDLEQAADWIAERINARKGA